MTPDASQQWTLPNTLKAPLCAAAPVSSRVLKYARKRSHEGTLIFYGIPDKTLFGFRFAVAARALPLVADSPL